MKKPANVTLTIPKPCEQRWDDMRDVADGRFCEHCQHTVIDFTSWSDSELYAYFASNKQRVCGRYLPGQINRPINIPYQPNSKLYRMMVAMGLTLIFSQPYTGTGQTKTEAVVVQQSATQTTVAKQDSIGGIKGNVVDEKNQPMINALLQVYSGDVLKGSCASDYDGNYAVAPLEPGTYNVIVLYVSYDTLMIKGVRVADTMTTINAKMALAGEPLIGAVAYESRHDARVRRRHNRKNRSKN